MGIDSDCFCVEVDRADLANLYRTLSECYAEKVIDSSMGSKGVFEEYGPRSQFGLHDKIKSESWLQGVFNLYDGGRGAEYQPFTVSDGLSRIGGSDGLGALILGHVGTLSDLPAIEEALQREKEGRRNPALCWVVNSVLRLSEYDSLFPLLIEGGGLLVGREITIDTQWWSSEFDNDRRYRRVSDLQNAIALIQEKCRPSGYASPMEGFE